MIGYDSGLVWGFIIGAPLAGAIFWLGKVLIDQHFEERARRLGLPVRPDEEPTP